MIQVTCLIQCRRNSRSIGTVQDGCELADYSEDTVQSKWMCFLQSSLDELLTTVMRQRKIANNLKAKWRLQKSKFTTKTTEASQSLRSFRRYLLTRSTALIGVSLKKKKRQKCFFILDLNVQMFTIFIYVFMYTLDDFGKS